MYDVVDEGRETLNVTSKWHDSLGDAEAECQEKINGLIDSTVDELEDDEATIVSIEHDPIKIEEREDQNNIQYKASTKAVIEWILYREANKHASTQIRDLVASQKSNQEERIKKELAKKIPKRVEEDPIFKLRHVRYETYYSDLDVIAKENEIQQLPDYVTRTKETYRNESPSLPLPRDYELEEITKTGYEVTITKNVETEYIAEANVKFKVKIAELGTSFSFSRKVKIGEERVQSYEKIRTEKVAIEREIPPCTELSYEVLCKHYRSRIPFVGRKKFDIKAIAMYEYRMDIPNHLGHGPTAKITKTFLASNFFAEEMLSTVIEGFIDNIDTFETNILQKSNEICNGDL